MDSISQWVLWAGVAGLIWWKKLGKKAYRWGIALGTIPDLDVFVGPWLYSDPMQAMFFHRWPTHSLLFAFVVAPIVAYMINKIHRWDKASRWTWTLVAFGAIVTHPLLDSLTNYGTRLLWPFTDAAYSLNSVFIVDPLYTIPFFILVIVALCIKDRLRAWKVNMWWVVISTSYLLLGIIIKFAFINPAFVEAEVAQNIVVEKSFTTPEALQLLLWRKVMVTDTDFIQWWYSILDSHRDISYVSVPRMTELLDPYRGDSKVQKLIDKSEWYYLVRPRAEWGVFLADVRFGGLNGWASEAQDYAFGYSIYEKDGEIIVWDRGWWSGRNIESDTFKVWRERIKGI